MGRLILIEGLEKAGKSTLCRLLADRLAASGVEVEVHGGTLCPDNPIAPLADRFAVAPEAGSLAVAAHAWDARHFTPPRGVHLQDSLGLVRVARERAQGNPVLARLMGETLEHLWLDGLVYLTARAAVRRQRGAQDADPRQADGRHADARLHAEFRHLCLERGGSEIDTSDMDAQEVAEHAWRALGLHLCTPRRLARR